MRVVVYLGDTVRGKTLGVAHYATNLVHSLANRHGTEVTLLGGAKVVGAYHDLPEVRLIDEASIESVRSQISRDHDLLLLVHQFQPRPVDLPTVVVVHDLHVYDVGWKYAKGRSRLVRSLHKNVIRANAVVSHFPNTITRLMEVEPLAEGKTFLTVCPSLIDDYDFDQQTVASVDARFGLGDDRPMVLYPAQLQLHKNHWNLLNAVYNLKRDGLDLRLICTGGSAWPESWADALALRVGYLGLTDVHFPGYVLGSDLRALYQRATAVVSPSLAEGGAYLAQEALLHDTAVACSAIPGAVAHLERMNMAVPTFDPYDVTAIAAGLRQAVDHSKDITTAYGPAREVVSGWTWDVLADQVVESLESVA